VKDKSKKTENCNRRCGFSRRSFAYAHHIPERRNGNDRRKAQGIDTAVEDQAMLEAESKRVHLNPSIGKDSVRDVDE
jgi:hypothetical protein